MGKYISKEKVLVPLDLYHRENSIPHSVYLEAENINRRKIGNLVRAIGSELFLTVLATFQTAFLSPPGQLGIEVLEGGIKDLGYYWLEIETDKGRLWVLLNCVEDEESFSKDAKLLADYVKSDLHSVSVLDDRQILSVDAFYPVYLGKYAGYRAMKGRYGFRSRAKVH